ncbi:sugar transferase [Streptomyces sp. NPDC050145]|uniref:sugar transferase n=1 Tax=Streptomyces sp. NPDC050145 TaxID=3365602 RepID=UPI00379258FF
MTAGHLDPLTADIVIVNWNTGPYLEECLRSIARADRSVLAVRTVVVVDNASTDGSASGLDVPGLPLKVIANTRNRGFAAACNQGAALCGSDHVLFLNPDTRLFPDTLRIVGEFLHTPTAERFGIVGVRNVDEQGRPGVSCSRFPSLRGFVGMMTGLDLVLPALFPPRHLRPSETVRSGPVDQVIGAFFLVRRSLLDALEGFDERYFLYYEEVDLALRARRRGRPSYFLNDARVFHAENVSTDQIRGKRLGYSLCSRTLFAFRHWPRWRAGLLVALSLTVEPAARFLRAMLHGGPELRDTAAGYAYFLRWLARPGVHAARPGQDTPPSREESAATTTPVTPTRLSTPRRALDIAVSLTALVALSPLLAVIAVLVRATSRGSVLFRQRRVGEGGREFTLYKFRTLRPDLPGPEVTGSDDARVTRVGRQLRRLSLDELPQLFNVARGDMTLVGPRPETPGLARRYPPACRWVLDHRPGLTGPVQLRSRAYAAQLQGQADPEAYYLEVMVPRRVALDAEFLADPTLAHSVRLLVRTARYMLSAVGERPGGTRKGG